MADNCIISEGEPLGLHSSKLIKARKPHRCDECKEEIQPGDLHERVKGRDEHGWIEYRTCARCVNVRNDYFEDWVYTMMVEDFMEAHGFDYRDGIPADFAPCRAQPQEPTT